ncbi:MAG TPA: Ig-like domain-containing protein, partial [Candidatus Dormibacteraeota bacterium]|nr:Ig-like domain-containing protein [Candidatus Dormibacteraeota bacterium]
FGTDSNAVAAATTASPEFKGASAVVSGTNIWALTNLDSRLTYFWRIDELDIDNGVTNVAQGFTWMFRTRHLAFPTAEGYGRFARGGRGGVVIEVSNLLDYDSNEPVIPGSYRAAIEASGPRTVVFRVSGLIRLKRPCTINAANGYLTIAGQTAPGEGICLSNWRAGITSCSDVIVRFIRCRLGDYSRQAMDGVGLGNSTHSIIDHCSISWTMDEASSSRQSGAVGSSSCNITFQHNIISESLQHSYHYDDSNRSCTNCYQQHGFAASISGEIGSYHHNLIAHSTDRNWSLAGGLDQSAHYAGSLDIRNNVVYNWLGRTTDGGVARCNYASNYYKPFPSNPYATWLLKLDAINTNWGSEAYYMVGNIMEGGNYQTNNWGPAFYNDAATMNMVRTNSEIFPSFVTTQSATNALKFVLCDVGCNLPVPDVIDQRIIGEVLNGNTHYIGTNGPAYTINGYPQAGSPNYPGIIDSQTDVRDATNSPNYPWPAYWSYNAPADSDHDGLPDWWEELKGLNPHSTPGDFSDANGDSDGDGYANLEDYLNWLSLPHFECASDSTIDIDLSQFTRGFSNAPVRAVSSPTNGTVTLLGDGKTARFVPSAGLVGLAGFQFTVHDSVSATFTNVIGLHIGPLTSPTIYQARWTGNSFNLSISGQLGPIYSIESSSNLLNWTTVFQTNAPATPFSWSDPNGGPARFYRSKVGP